MMSNVIENAIVKKRNFKPKLEKLELSYINYLKPNFDLKKYKLPELKQFLKSNKLPISGTKPILNERIKIHFFNINAATNIQRIFRGYIVREIIKLRGPAVNNRSLCVNDTDFVTMDKITEIPHINFFSYVDKKGFTYGFDVLSLMQAYKSRNMENPYNREKFEISVKRKFKSLYKKTCLLYPEIKINNLEQTSNSPPSQHNRNYRRSHRSTSTNELTQESLTRYNNLMLMRAKPIEQRMQDLFMEIDQLGNYTQVSWFSNLNLSQYIRLYRCMYEIWNYRSGLSRDSKQKICPFYGPFDRIFQTPVFQDDLTLLQIQTACTTVFETLIFSGVDDDHRKLGAFHALSSLTVVSTGARQAMPWLYESVAF